VNFCLNWEFGWDCLVNRQDQTVVYWSGGKFRWRCPLAVGGKHDINSVISINFMPLKTDKWVKADQFLLNRIKIYKNLSNAVLIKARTPILKNYHSRSWTANREAAISLSLLNDQYKHIGLVVWISLLCYRQTIYDIRCSRVSKPPSWTSVGYGFARYVGNNIVEILIISSFIRRI